MRRSCATHALVMLNLLTSGFITGCGAPERSTLSAILPFGSHENLAAQETEQRQKFLSERDPAAFRWLLRNRIGNEMSVEEVSHILGESGERRYDDREFKTNGGFYQTTDIGYQWGPDRNGRSVVLFFREGKLINFDPSDFRE